MGRNEEGKVYTNIIPYFKLLIQDPNIADKVMVNAVPVDAKKLPVIRKPKQKIKI